MPSVIQKLFTDQRLLTAPRKRTGYRTDRSRWNAATVTGCERHQHSDV